MEQSGAKSQRSLNVELTFAFGYPATKTTKQTKITKTYYLPKLKFPTHSAASHVFLQVFHMFSDTSDDLWTIS